MFSIVKRIVFIISMAPLAAAAGPNDQFTAADGATINFSSTATQGALAAVLNSYGKFSTTQVVERLSSPRALTTAEIDRIIGLVEDSPLAKFGLGQSGGGRVSIDMDVDQLERSVGLKNRTALAKLVESPTSQPKADTDVSLRQGPLGVEADVVNAKSSADLAPNFQVVEHNTFTASNLRSDLEALQKAEVAVRSVTFRGFLLHNGAKVAGTLQAVLVGGAMTNLGYGMSNLMDSELSSSNLWVRERCEDNSQCRQPSAWSWWLNTSEAVFFRFYADPTN